jgi:hypothetical protein
LYRQEDCQVRPLQYIQSCLNLIADVNTHPFASIFHSLSHSALTTFRKETDDGDELELHGSEVASLMNLIATDSLAEEAVALIPSLARFPEAAVDEILDLIRSTMIRIVS